MKHITLLALTLAAGLSAGCIWGPSKGSITLIKELSKDDASAHLEIPTPYGIVKFTRTNPHLETQPHSINADGDVSVNNLPSGMATGSAERTKQLEHLDRILNRPPAVQPPLPGQ